MEFITSILDFIVGALFVDWRKISRKRVPVRAETHAQNSRKNDIMALVFCVVFVAGFVSLFALLA